MKKNILTLLFILSVILSYSQKLGENRIPLLNIQKDQQIKGDTIWLYHRYDINKWEESEFHPYLSALFDYYPGTANAKYAIVINMEEQDTLQKFNYYYDDSNRITATVMQNYTGNSGNVWANYDSITQFYNLEGLDSLFIRYTWNINDTAWKKHDSRGISYYENTANNLIYMDSSSVWNGQEWVINDGDKIDYLFNEFGNVYDKKYSIYQGGKWVYDYWVPYYLTNDTTGEYDAYDNYIWDEDHWENLYRFTEVILHNWQGYTNNVSDVEYIIKEFWDGQQWLFVVKDSILYDNFGGNTGYKYGWYNDKWELSDRFNSVFNERKLPTFITREQYLNNKWDTIWGTNHTYEYLGSIWRAMHLEEYDTALMKWVPTYDHILSDFTYVLNTPETKTTGMSSGIRIIPNPSKNSILIKLNDESDRIKTVKVFDISGREILGKKSDTAYNVRLDISTFKKGTYIINVETRKGKNIRDKFIKN